MQAGMVIVMVLIDADERQCDAMMSDAAVMRALRELKRKEHDHPRMT